MSWNVLIVVGCLVAGYAIVSVLMNTRADDLRPPPKPGEHLPSAPGDRLPRAPGDMPPRASNVPRLEAPRAHDWPVLLDIPRSSSQRDIEAAYRRQLGKAEALQDRSLVERLRVARDAALAEKK